MKSQPILAGIFAGIAIASVDVIVFPASGRMAETRRQGTQPRMDLCCKGYRA